MTLSITIRNVTFSMKTLSITTLSITIKVESVSIMTLNMTRLSIMTLSKHYNTKCNI
jgi:hypothetical protein